jgi:hypothetical protein
MDRRAAYRLGMSPTGREKLKLDAACRRVLGLGFALLGLVSACRRPTSPGPICTMIFVYGLAVEIRDAVTGAGIAAGAVAVAREGSYSETLEHGPVDSVSVHGAGERAGTYTITVSRPGYVAWTSPPIKVTADQCHVQPVLVKARLAPAS